MRLLFEAQLLLWILLTPFANGLLTVDSTLASACIYYEKSFDWGCGSHTNDVGPYACRCGNINWLGTITNCIYENSNSTRLINHALKHTAIRCLQKGGFNYTLKYMQTFYQNGSRHLRDPTDDDKHTQVYTTLRVNQTEFDWYHKKAKDFTLSVQRSQWFGWGLVFYWATVIAITTALNFNKRVVGAKRNSNWIKRQIVLPSVFKQFHQRVYLCWNFIPLELCTRLEALVVCVFVVQVVLSLCVGYNQVSAPHPYFTSRFLVNLDLVSYRANMMCIALFPVIFLFGIRNNPFVPLTGISFSTFNFYHKWCAYVCVALAFIHAICRTIWATHEDGYASWYANTYWKWGISACTLAFVLISHSNKYIRDAMYEFFLMLHKVMSVLFIVCMHYHCKDFGWQGWIWSMAGILCFDRFMRLLRILLSGGLQTATLINCDQGVVKMIIRKPRFFKYYPGSFAFFYFLDLRGPVHAPWQSHPFTILNTPSHEERGSGDKLVVYFKVKKGITRRLLDKLEWSGRNSVQCKVLIEGPYGNTLAQISPKANRKFVGVSAGVGVSAVYPHFVKLLEDQKTDICHSFYWVINNLSYVAWFSSELYWLQSHNCNVKVIYTGSRKLEDSFPIAADDNNHMLKTLDVEKLYGRPGLMELVYTEVASCNLRSTDVTFISCGPSEFNDKFRHTVRNCITKNLKIDVDLEEESFSW